LTAVSKIAAEQQSRQRRRADAERSIAAILDAAEAVLAERPDASMSDIAAEAGLTRQTVYAHFESREVLLTAVAERALAHAVAAIDAAEPERGHPADALDRLVAAWWSSVARHARVLEALRVAFPGQEGLHDFHGPILERLVRLIRRGQRAGEFDRSLDASWLALGFLALMHAAADEVAAERLRPADAGRALEVSIPRLFGAAA
jgi:AcrR family transcriptional regulator